MEASLRATLTVDDKGCVQAKATTGSPIALVWPRGYSVRGDAQSFEVLDGDKNVVARSGASLAMGGGGVDVVQDAWTDRDCAAGGELWMVGKVDPA